MTEISDEYESPGEDVYGEEADEEFAPAVVPVRVIATENEQLAPSYATCMTWAIPVAGTNSPVMFLQKRYKRYKAKMLLSIPGAGSVTINTKWEPLTLATPQGFTVTLGLATTNFPLPEYDAQSPMFAIASIAGATIAVIDEAYGIVQ